MSFRSRRTMQLALLVAIALTSIGAAQQLNPTVKVLPQASGPVPSECEQGLAPQAAPRITQDEKNVARETLPPPPVVAPPSTDLRAALREAQTAAEHNDRPSFVDALARARTLLETYPAGGERTAAENAVAVLNDVDRLWNYQQTSRTGAFFDAGSDVYGMVSRYPGYETFIRRDVLVDATGTKFYPSAESRDFLAQQARERLAQLGVRPAAAAPTRIARPIPEKTAAAPRTTRPPAASHRVTTVKPRPAARPEHRTTTSEAAAPPTTTSRPPHRVRHAAPPRHVPQTATKPAPRAAEAQPVAKSAPAPKPAPRPAPVPAAPPPGQAPATETAAVTTGGARSTAAPAPAMTQTVTTGAPAQPAVSTASTATATPAASTDTTSSSAAEKPAESGGKKRSMLVPIILIVIGIGVLILLFRASSQ